MEGCCRGDSALEILGQTSVAAEPGKEALDHPAPRMHGEADLAGLLAHDLDEDPGRVRHSFGGIGAIGEDPLDESKPRTRRRSNGMAPSRSWTEALWTWRTNPRPSVSTMA